VDPTRDRSAETDPPPPGAPPARLVDGDIRGRDRVTRLLAGCLTLGWWIAGAWALTCGWADRVPLAGAIWASGWGLSVVPVHCAPIRRRIALPPRPGRRGVRQCSLCAAAGTS
jgi:hypothetical protein